MPGLVPGIHVLAESRCPKNVDGRDEPGHDETQASLTNPVSLYPFTSAFAFVIP
jgi:hypothetical protein